MKSEHVEPEVEANEEDKWRGEDYQNGHCDEDEVEDPGVSQAPEWQDPRELRKAHYLPT